MTKSRLRRALLISLTAVSCMLFQLVSAHAFGLSDLSSSAETAKSAAEGTSLLSKAKKVYSGFYDSTENLIDAQTATMSLINPTRHANAVAELGSINSESGVSKLFKMVAFSESMDSTTQGMDLTGRLTAILTDPASLEKAKGIYNNASGAYTSGSKSIIEAKTLYQEIKNFIASPSSKGLSESLLSGLGSYSDKILPFIIEHGPARVKTAAGIADAFKGFL
ncbi:hypothetical protein [Maridesulfovibrio hydrothermalis]|uniref:DUF4197 domain-containing protein n=1 Tax=Maridesulfovibrio hydrothermalis AM13 = DSM 14728 TaxID=1121451 RepID=L0R6P1_9BACT|nr:hypothetical protein [Maridesulfovibrio hydrothermalis]CCO22379.1 conserved exported protein of unknown function [Maridesulfovibrio hydrothermalis AM13 = DSM 14728]